MLRVIMRGAVAFGAAGLALKLTAWLGRVALPMVIGGGEHAAYVMGIVSYPFTIFQAVSLVASVAVPVAVVKTLLDPRGGEVWTALRAAWTLGLLVGGALMVLAPLLLLMANRQAYVSTVVVVLAVVISFGAAGERGVLQANHRLGEFGLSQLWEQVSRTVTMLLLALAGHWFFGPLGAALGVALSFVIGAVVGAAYARRKRPSLPDEGRPRSWRAWFDLAALRTFRGVLVPVAVSNMAWPGLLLLDLLMVPGLLASSGVSSHRAMIALGALNQLAASLVNISSALTAALAASALPALQGRARSQSSVHAMKMLLVATVVVGMGATVVVMALSRWLPDLLWSFPQMWMVLMLLAPVGLFLGVHQVSTALLQSHGNLKVPMIGVICGLGLKVVITVFTVGKLGELQVEGAALADTLGLALAAAINLGALIPVIRGTGSSEDSRSLPHAEPENGTDHASSH